MRLRWIAWLTVLTTCESSRPGAISSPSSDGSWPSASTIFRARRGEARLRQVVAEEVDRRDERLRLQRQEARGAVEVVAVGVGIHLDLVTDDLRVEDVGAAAEVDDVQDVDVLAKLVDVHVELAQAVGDRQRRALARRADHEAGERDEPGEALGPDHGLAAAARAT